MMTSSYRSNLERVFNERHKLPYETTKLSYTVTHTYTPDFKLAPDRYVETKGLWVSQDRAKHKHIRQQHPNVRVLLVFQNAHRRLTKSSKTTYAQWCDKYGFCWMTEQQALLHTPAELLNILNNFTGKNQ